MKLLIVAAVIAVASAARLEYLERGYLPPDNSNLGTNGFGSNPGNFGNGFNTASNGLGTGLNSGNTQTNGFGTNGLSSNDFGLTGQTSTNFGSNGIGGSQGTNGFGSNGIGGSQGTNGLGSNGISGPQGTTGFASNGIGGSQGTTGFGSNGGNTGFAGATSNQYLPPDQTSSFGTGFNFGGSSIKPACPSCGQSGFSQQYNQLPSSVPGTSYGVPQFASSLTSGSNFASSPGVVGSTFGTSAPSDSNSGLAFGSSNGNFGSSSFGAQGSFGSQDSANRQYLAPRPSSQNPPQQPFDEKYGYIY